MKVITNLILIVILVISLVVVLNYKEEVKEAMGNKEPSRLMTLYEKTTNTECLCADPRYGFVTYISNS